MTARKATWAKEAEYHPAPVDWYRQPRLKRVRKADPANAGRWFYLVAVATQSRADGLLLAADGTPFDASDFADEYGGDEDDWEEFLELCREHSLLDLASTSLGSAWKVLPWSTWNRDAARQAALGEDSYRKKLERKVDKLEAQLDQVKPDVHPEPGHVHGASTVSMQEQSRAEQSRAEQSRAEQSRSKEDLKESRAEQSMSAHASAACLPAVSQDEFWKMAQALCCRLSQKSRWSKDDSSRLRDTLATTEWQANPDWRHRLGALELAAQRAQHRIENGEQVSTRWRWMLSWASDHLADSKQRCEINDFAREKGHDPKPLRWVPT